MPCGVFFLKNKHLTVLNPYVITMILWAIIFYKQIYKINGGELTNSPTLLILSLWPMWFNPAAEYRTVICISHRALETVVMTTHTRHQQRHSLARDLSSNWSPSKPTQRPNLKITCSFTLDSTPDFNLILLNAQMNNTPPDIRCIDLSRCIIGARLWTTTIVESMLQSHMILISLCVWVKYRYAIVHAISRIDLQRKTYVTGASKTAASNECGRKKIG